MVANTLMKMWKNVLMLLVVLVLAYFCAVLFGQLYDNAFHLPTGFSSFISSSEDYKFIDGIGIAYLFFLFLLFTAFGDTKKYYWAGIASIPAAAFLIYFDFSHIYFHILFPLAGWVIGWGIHRLRSGSMTT